MYHPKTRPKVESNFQSKKQQRKHYEFIAGLFHLLCGSLTQMGMKGKYHMHSWRVYSNQAQDRVHKLSPPAIRESTHMTFWGWLTFIPLLLWRTYLYEGYDGPTGNCGFCYTLPYYKCVDSSGMDQVKLKCHGERIYDGGGPTGNFVLGYTLSYYKCFCSSQSPRGVPKTKTGGT